MINRAAVGVNHRVSSPPSRLARSAKPRGPKNQCTANLLSTADAVSPRRPGRRCRMRTTGGSDGRAYSS